MADKFQVLTDTRHIRTVKEAAAGAARTQGDAFLLNGVLVFPMETVGSGKECLHVYQADVVEVTASAASGQIAAVNFNALLGKVYWDDTNKRVTNSASGNTLIGRALELKDLSGGVAAGATLRIELNPNV